METKIEIPEKINVEVNERKIIVKGPKGSIDKDFDDPRYNKSIQIKKEDSSLIISSQSDKRKTKAMIGTIKAHVRNMIQGLDEGFKYKLQAVSVHFPITLKVDEANNKLLIKNFLGEKKDRVIRLISGVNIKINKDVIELESADIEKAGLVASNIEKGTKIRFRDRRIFQDGIFITEKPGRKII